MKPSSSPTPRIPALLVALLATALLAGCFSPATKPGAEETDNRRGGGPQAGKARGAGGLEIAYTLYGEGDGTLVLVHGWGGNQLQWLGQVEDLAQRYTVVTVDLGGHGLSGRGRSGASLSQLTTDLGAVLDQIGARQVILIGHSLGGLVALETARAKPEAVRGVIGVESFHYPPLEAAVWQQLLSGLEADFPAACRSFVRGLFAVTTEEPLVDETAEEVCHLEPATGIALLRELAGFDLGRALSTLPPGLPIRAIDASEAAEPRPDDDPPSVPAAEQERALSAQLQRFHADTRVHLVFRSGHYPMLEQSAELTRQLAEALRDIEAKK